jgi:hypothetical protein
MAQQQRLRSLSGTGETGHKATHRTGAAKQMTPAIHLDSSDEGEEKRRRTLQRIGLTRSGSH